MIVPEKSATQIPTFTKIDAIFCTFTDVECEIPGVLCVHV